MDKVPFLVVQDIFLTATAREADVVLPAASFAEKEGTFTNAERRIQRVRQGIPLPGEAKTDYAIFEQLSARFGKQVSYTGAPAVFAQIAASVPAYAGIEYSAIGAEGVVWGGETLEAQQKEVVPVEGGKAVDAPFQLTTGSILYHSGTVSTRAKGPLAVVPAPFVEFGRSDAQALGIKEGDVVTIKAGGTEIKLAAKIDLRMPKGVLFAPYHFGAAGLNRIFSGQAAVPVEIVK